MNTSDRFEAVSENFQKFDRVKKKRSARPDLHAFILLDELCPNPSCNMVCSTGHSEFWLDVAEYQVDRLTDKQILELVRCGVMYDVKTSGLNMFA